MADTMVGISIFFQKNFRGVSLYFRYWATAVSNPIMIVTYIWILLNANSWSAGGATFVRKILLNTGSEVFAITTSAERKKTREPINIQNSLDEALSSFCRAGIFL